MRYKAPSVATGIERIRVLRRIQQEFSRYLADSYAMIVDRQVQAIKTLVDRNSALLKNSNSRPVRRFIDDLGKIVNKKLDVIDRKQKTVTPVENKVKISVMETPKGPEVNLRIKASRNTEQISQKSLTPGRYYEIHGPGGRVKKTTNLEVMKKAKKQGIHVEVRYKMPTGKAPVGTGFYDMKLNSLNNRSNYFLNKNDPKFQEAQQNYKKNMQHEIDKVQRYWASELAYDNAKLTSIIFGR